MTRPDPRWLLAAGLLLLSAGLHPLPPAPLHAQVAMDGFRPHAEWLTVETEHLAVHYPAEAHDWVQPLLARMESMHREVAELVGKAPDRQVTVLVTDPVNQSNGYAIPLMNRPLTTLWPTPPTPRTSIGEHRGWGELLFVHEYAHLAHLTFPSRNRAEEFLWQLLPAQLGPVTRRSPRWIVEGYATWVEGRLTGQGRPHGVARPAFIRQRALEGRLPTYAQLSGASGYQDMASAYLVGSAFLEWLVAREGEESLNHLWRRMSARERRSFSDAFSGVFGGPPEELYGRFTVEMTEKALAVRDVLQDAGLEEGELWQLRRWSTGDPALSPDGDLMAVALHQREGPSRLEVWETTKDEEAAARREEEREQLLERDPLDVPAVQWRPPSPRSVASLPEQGGRPFLAPRFLPDGERILAVRWEPLGDGTFRPDLYLWDFESNELTRVTRGAGIRQADPSPDGSEAVGVRCRWGSCDLVRVALEGGEVTLLASGSPDVVYYRPRWSPDGTFVVASVQEEGRWRLVRVEASGEGAGTRYYLDPEDGANRYDAEFLDHEDGSIVTVSDLGGVPNLEILDPESGSVRTLTRVLGEVAAPVVQPANDHEHGGWIHFLHMHSRGTDLRRLHPDSSQVRQATPLSADLWPAARRLPDAPVDTFATGPVSEPQPYGLGRQRITVLPAGGFDAGGGAFQLVLSSTDPVGRLGLMARGALADSEAWGGASGAGILRLWPVHLRAELFHGRRNPSGSSRPSAFGDFRMTGGLVALEGSREGDVVTSRGRVGSVVARVEGVNPPDAGVLPGQRERVDRVLAFAALGGTATQERGDWQARQGVQVNASGGRTGGEGWTRLRARGQLAAGTASRRAAVEVEHIQGSGDSPFEELQVGGMAPGLFDDRVLDWHVAMPALPPTLLTGQEVTTARGALVLGGLEPYLWLVSVDTDWSRWHRVAGVEGNVQLGAAPELGLPATTVRFGVGRSLDAPFEDRTRLYFSVGLRP